jgi:murein DD-endopeptidase MepM/ murein hydrolase activator NlpD
MGGCGKGAALAFFFVFLFPLPCLAENGSPGSGNFPLITQLDGRDMGFRQYMADVEHNRYRMFNQGRTRESPQVLAESLTIYQYTPREGEDILFLAARCNIPYSAIASLNRLSHPVMLEAGKPLLLPSGPGLFVPLEPVSDLEQLMAAVRFPSQETRAIALNLGTMYLFFPGEDFGSTERAFFLNTGFRFPLRSFRLSSAYGPRQNPVTGNHRFHEGIDLAAPAGTEVYAAGEGVVTEIGEDPVYGLYIIIKHGENWASLYGHLLRVEIALHTIVRSTTLIGRVGSTGQSTGPHLHFELRQNGRARDPDKYLFQR